MELEENSLQEFVPPSGERFISFEGPEGGGKSTQSRRLAEQLRSEGVRVVLTREPGGTRTGEHIRELLLSFDADRLTSTTEALLMSAARAQHVNDVIIPALRRGDWVITDRYVDSTYAYQGYGRGLNLDLLGSTQNLATQGVMPWTTFLLDLPVEIGLTRRFRAFEALNRLDVEDWDFHERVRTGYHYLATADRQRWLTIDSTKDEETIASEIWNTVQTRFGARLYGPPDFVSGFGE